MCCNDGKVLTFTVARSNTLCSPPPRVLSFFSFFLCFFLQSTGIVGLARNTNPLPGLAATYNATLEVLGGMPADAAYRKNVEILTNDRLATVTSVSNFANQKIQTPLLVIF